MFTDAKKPRSQQGLLSQQNTIAQGTAFEGDLKSEGDFRIEGAIIGTLTTKGKVVIGSTGKINGSLSCKNADIEGSFKGELVVSETLSLRATARVQGEVQTGKLAVEPGASFNANCQMKDSVKELKTQPKPTIETSAKSGQTA
ncbi:polymer-forming cytoskeletal protein [Flavobacteriaceae bacterium]|nr:polymer-forming cytoskeletal protein [Flavobacteriaceae bacterium]MDG1777882.1 polymer-forming cytoskeletal protein [Flavobacteriaceae bacterium]